MSTDEKELVDTLAELNDDYERVYFVRFGEKFEIDIPALKALATRISELEASNRYALTTFRALDQYTFENSDHALLIAEAVKKLEADHDQ